MPVLSVEFDVSNTLFSIIDNVNESVKENLTFDTEKTNGITEDIFSDSRVTRIESYLSNSGQNNERQISILPEVEDVISDLVSGIKHISDSGSNPVFGEIIDDDSLSESDSPIKIKRKKIKYLPEELEESTDCNTTVENENFNNISVQKSDSPIEIKNKAFGNLSSELGESNEFLDDIYDNESKLESVDEEFPMENEDNEASNFKFEAEIPSTDRKSRFSSNREVKGKELMKQSLSLPYFHLPKPDFRKYLEETDKRLEKPLQDVSDSIKKVETIKRVMLKPANNIVFEIESSKRDRVEPFRKKVMNMMTSVKCLKSETSEKFGMSYKKNASNSIGAERMSWKMKLLDDIAKKKEAALKERNEMLEEALENEEEEQGNVEDSESEEIAEEDEVDVHFLHVNSLMSSSETDQLNVDSPEIPKGIHHEDHSRTMFSNNLNRDWEAEKDMHSSPLCFSLPSFQPDGGFSKSENTSSSIFSPLKVTQSFNEAEPDKETPSLFDTEENEELKDISSCSSIARHDEKIYDKVLAEEKLLTNERSMPEEMTADVLDICSGQFLDSIEVPKTPPIANVSSGEESDMDVSYGNYAIDQHPGSASDSDSEDELKFKRKVLKKRIRPISPIDEESRHGEEDTTASPASVLLETNTNFEFSKNLLSSPKDESNNSDNAAEDCILAKDSLNLNYNSDESLIDDERDQVKEVCEPTKAARDFFDIEAELSGEEGSSDEDEAGMDGEDELEFEDAELPTSEVLRDQIGSLHLKHLLDDDDQMIRQVKNHFLDEGELHSDAARQRKFNWSFNPAEIADNPGSSASENEEEINEVPFHQDKLKWMQENANKNDVSEVIDTQEIEASFKIEVQRKISSQIIAQRDVQTVNKRPRNSFLDEEEAKKSFKKIKLDVVNAQGTRATKNFVFVETSGPSKKKISNHKNRADSSVFDII